VSTSSFAAVFYLEAALLIGVAVVLLPMLRERDGPGRAPLPALGPRLALRTLVHDRVFLTFTSTMTAYMVVYTQGTTTLPVVMSESGFSVPSYGVLLAINGVLLCLFQLPLVRMVERLPTSIVLGWAVALTAAGYLVQVFAEQWWHYAAAVVLWSIGELGIFPVGATIIADIAPPHLLATYKGVYGTTWTVGRTLAALLGGLVLGAVGPGGLWLCCVAALLVTLTVVLRTRPERERREAAGRAVASLATRP
jgi:predicted MFS family arabinose efflux permease